MGETHSIVLIIKLHTVCKIATLPKTKKTISETPKIMKEAKDIFSRQAGRSAPT